jgi:hypothetical protein
MSTSQPPRVFVTQEVRNPRTNIDYSPARKFGDVKFLTIMDFSSDDDSISNKVLVEELRSRLQDFNPTTDFIVTTGSPLVSAVVFMILRERTTFVQFLRWSNRDFCYNKVTISLQ